MSKLLCCGDLHLGQGSELGRAPGDRLRDQGGVLDAIDDLAVERAVDAVLVAGDTFNGPSVPPEQLQLFAQFVAQLHAASIPIVAITGNGVHDQAVRQTNGMDIFTHIPGIVVSSRPEIIEVAGVQVCTLPWVHPGRYIAAHGRDVSRDEVNGVVADLLLEAARELRAQINGDGPSILMPHWSISGSALPTGLPVDQLREPVLDAGELADLGFDWVVAGHIHLAQSLSVDGRDFGFYVSSPLPLNFGEAGSAHGVRIIDTDAGTAEFVPVESRPLVTISFDFTGSDAAMLDLFTPEIPDGAIVRAQYRATADQARHFDTGLLRRELAAAGAHSVKIVPDIVRADRARVEGVDESLGTLQALELYVAANQLDPALADAMRAKTTEYLEAVA
jgi:exonuclease SbcD